jgi:hypothetical protein
VRVERGAIPDEWPEGEFDLVILSEVGYYCRDLAALAKRAWAALTDHGVLVACHWRHPAPDHPHTAAEVYAALDRPAPPARQSRPRGLPARRVVDIRTFGRRRDRSDRVIRDVVVTVPAADERDEIAGCLEAVENAIAQLHRHSTVRGHVVVALDGCRDDTAAIVAGFAKVRTVACGARRVGTARRHAAEMALARWGPSQRVWLASTDADCRVPANWLVEMMAAARSGAQLVLGTVRPRPGLAADVEQARYDAHILRDGHAHVHGAQLGVAGSAYVRLGGWRDLAVHQDVDLVERAVAVGIPIARSGKTPVWTSSRPVGRAPAGYASYLQALHRELPAADRRRRLGLREAGKPVTSAADTGEKGDTFSAGRVCRPTSATPAAAGRTRKSSSPPRAGTCSSR